MSHGGRGLHTCRRAGQIKDMRWKMDVFSAKIIPGADDAEDDWNSVVSFDVSVGIQARFSALVSPPSISSGAYLDTSKL